MMWHTGASPALPDGQVALARLYGGAFGGPNFSRFKLPAMDALYQRLTALPDGPERDASFDEAKRLAVAYMPEKTRVHRMFTDLVHPWLVGYRRPLFWFSWYEMVDIESDRP